ncbi:FxSxx-COOH system tetratricopeptide repeat protein [Streptomyces rubiginosohelvolus]|uniref:FxSxx-COOH system tetratricopeptide repeat protein n=1 Tax=Streptomyces rubiginosohelvolus TaxID=67362 RepID=UPI00367F8DB0
MNAQEVYIVAAEDEADLAERVAQPLRTAGYRVSHSGTVPVGGSIVEAAVQALDRNSPVVLCATQRGVGSAWTHQLVNAARARGSSWVFVVQMEADAYVGQLAVNTVVARYCDDPARAIADLEAALQQHFPSRPVPPPPPPPSASTTRTAPQFLDEPSATTEFDHDVVRAFRDDLREEVLVDHPASLTATEFLRRTGVWNDGVLTRTGVLMFARYPGSESVRSMVKCVEYFGGDRSASRYAVTLEGPVTSLITLARGFVADRVRRGERPTASLARSAPDYELPMIAVREIIANALVHRDYSRFDSCVHVRLFSDRLEISSPGTWSGRALEEATPQDLSGLEGQSVKRNFQLARLLTWNRLVEGEGSGIPTAVADCDSVGAVPPQVIETDGFVSVTLRRHLAKPPFTTTSAARSAWPIQVGVVPRKADTSLQRTEELAVLEAATGSEGVVLTGMAGVGKTQLAARYATEGITKGRLDLLVWAPATSRESVLSTYAQAAVSLGLATPGEDVTAAANLFLSRLATADFRWLVVLDDVLDPADVIDLWPSPCPSGMVVVTTRRRDASLLGTARAVRVDTFTPEQSVAYLTQKLAAHGMSDQPHLLSQLADQLGHLPVALSHAAAYMVDVNLASSAYLSLLRDRQMRLQDVLPDSSGLPEHATLTATWALAMAQANRMRPAGLAGPTLQLASMLSPSGIPTTLFFTSSALQYLSARSAAMGEYTPTPLEARAALSSLNRLGLVSLERDPERVHVHRLVQRATLEVLSPPVADRLTLAAADSLAEAWPSVELDAGLAQSLRTCARALMESASEALWDDGVHPVLLRLAESTGETMPREAARYLGDLVPTAEGRLGPDHADVFKARSLKATYQAAAGDIRGASAELEQLVADTLRVLGPDHPESLRASHDLAWSRGQSGDPAAAVAALAEILSASQGVLGPDHPLTLSVRRSLATWRGESGDSTGSVTELQELLTSAERLLGPEHPDALVLRANLAWSVGRAGDAGRAVHLWRELVSDQSRVLGPDHPDTLTSRNNLASWLGQTGDVHGAATLQDEILRTQTRVLGPDHPDTLTSRNNLASWLGQRGDAGEAARILAQLAADRSRILGPDHPDTVVTRANLAHWMGVSLEASEQLADEFAASVEPIDLSLAQRVRQYLRGKDRSVPPWRALVDHALATGAGEVLNILVRRSTPTVSVERTDDAIAPGGGRAVTGIHVTSNAITGDAFHGAVVISGDVSITGNE